MFQLTRPTPAEIDAFLAAQRGSDFSYPQVGATRSDSAPRGYDGDHPRIDLLRHRSMTLGRSYGFEAVIHGPELLERVRGDWRAGRPFVEWVCANAGA